VHRVHLQQLASARDQTLERVGGLDQHRLEYSPAPGRWSVGEVLDHLVLMEDYFRALIDRLIEQTRVGEIPLVGITFADFNPSPQFLPKARLPALEALFAVLSGVTPFKAKELFARYRLVKMEAPDIGLPRGGRARSELTDDLLTAIRRTEALFDSHPELDYRRMVVRHPFFGRTNVLQILNVLTLHERRHHRQIGDIVSSPGFPK